MSRLPESWASCRLEDVAEWGSGGTPTRSNPDNFNGDIPWIKTGELGAMYIRDVEEHISAKAIQNSSAKIFPRGSVAVAMYGATIGKASILAIDAATNQACAVGRPIEGISISEFLYYYLISQVRGFVEAGKGGAQPNISQGIIKSWPFPLSPLNEQRRIVAKIEQLFSELDNGVECLEAAREQLKSYRQSVLNKAVVGNLAGSRIFPSKPLSAVINELGQGWSPRCLNHPSADDETWAVITTTAIQHGAFYDQENKQLPEELEPRSHLSIRTGDVLITRAGPRKRVGVACLVRHCRPRLMLCDKAYRLRADTTQVLPEWLELVLNSPSVLQKIEELKTGINDSGVNLTHGRFLALEIPVPTLPAQKAVLSVVDSLTSQIGNFEAQIETAMKQSEALRQSILKRAFSGQLVSQDSTDEPAAVLLERIRAEQKVYATKRRNNKIAKQEAA